MRKPQTNILSLPPLAEPRQEPNVLDCEGTVDATSTPALSVAPEGLSLELAGQVQSLVAAAQSMIDLMARELSTALAILKQALD